MIETVRTVRGACPHDCPDTCATVATVRDGRVVGFAAEPAHPYTNGWLCAKVRPYLELVYHPDRLRYPLRHVGPKGAGSWQRIGWDEAIAEITGCWQDIIAADGAAAILPYSYSGTLGLVQLAVCNRRLWNRMGASGLQRSICGAAAEAAVTATLGARRAPDPADLAHSRLIILWGHNPASTGPHVMPLLRQAQRNGAHVVVIDPRRTLTARSADEHIQPRPATDAALALGLMHVLFAEGLHHEGWLRANTIGWEALRQRAAEYPPERVAAITGVPDGAIVSLARRYGTTSPAMLKFADGVQRHGNGGQAARALGCLPAVGHAHAPECPPTPRTVNMNRLGAALAGGAAAPPIRSLFVFCANPVASAPNAGLIARGLEREDLFTVVHDLFLTDTARYADIVLPATSQLEQVDLHKPYGQRTLQYNEPAIAPLGEARSNWDVMRLLAKTMGYDEPWLQQDATAVIAEVLEATRARSPLLRDVTLERLQREGTVPLPFDEGNSVPFADLRFPTPSGKVELSCAAMAAQGLDPVPDYTPPAEFAGLPSPLTPLPTAGEGGEGNQLEAVVAEQPEVRAIGDGGSEQEARLVLISGASHHFVSSSLANLPSLRHKEGTPHVELNPADAASRGIADSDDVVVENERGWCRLRAVVTENVGVGVAVAPKGHWPQHSPDGRNINWTTSDALGDLAGQSTFHSNLVTIRRAT